MANIKVLTYFLVVVLIMVAGTNALTESMDIHTCAEKGTLDMMNHILNSGVDVNTLEPNNSTTPLFGAVISNNPEMVILLLKSGANPNVQANVRDNNTAPLHIAAADGYYYIASLLIKYGANVDIRDTYENTPLHMAAHSGHYEIVDLLIENKSNIYNINSYHQMPIHKASEATNINNINGLVMLLEKGCNVNTPAIKDLNMTPLMYASQKGLCANVKTLIRYGANQKIRNSNGETAYHLAKKNEYTICYLIVE